MGRDLPLADLQPTESVDGGAALRLAGAGGEQTLPVTVVEHPADILGPRFLDEVRPDSILRHAIPGPSRDAWDHPSLQELANLLCGEPFSLDPVPALADGDDWVGWMTRSRLLASPLPTDHALGRRLAEDLLAAQLADGSWGGLPATASAILHLLALGKAPSDDPLDGASRWLLEQPEPPPRPGMWMLKPFYIEDWVSRRKPELERELAPGEFHWIPPDGDVNYFSWEFPDVEQDQFRSEEIQQVLPNCARNHPPACEPRMVHVSGVVAEALVRCGHADHPRLRRYVNTVFHLGGEWGYWCGCGALGLFDVDVPASGAPPDLDVRRVAEDGRGDLAPWRWMEEAGQCARLANKPDIAGQGTDAEPFQWRRIPGDDDWYALVGNGWQNGDCWARTNRALSQHPSCPGSLAEHQAIYQASRYQTPLGEWDQGFPAGMLSLLSLYDQDAARSLVIKTVPWLRHHQATDGLWHQEELPRTDWGRPAHPASARLATYHICAALRGSGVLGRLRPDAKRDGT